LTFFSVAFYCDPPPSLLSCYKIHEPPTFLLSVPKGGSSPASPNGPSPVLRPRPLPYACVVCLTLIELPVFLRPSCLLLVPIVPFTEHLRFRTAFQPMFPELEPFLIPVAGLTRFLHPRHTAALVFLFPPRGLCLLPQLPFPQGSIFFTFSEYHEPRPGPFPLVTLSSGLWKTGPHFSTFSLSVSDEVLMCVSVISLSAISAYKQPGRPTSFFPLSFHYKS